MQFPSCHLVGNYIRYFFLKKPSKSASFNYQSSRISHNHGIYKKHTKKHKHQTFSTENHSFRKMSSSIAVIIVGSLSLWVMKSAQLKQVYILQHFMYAFISLISNHENPDEPLKKIMCGEKVALTAVGFLQCAFVTHHIVEIKNTFSRYSQQCNRGRITLMPHLSCSFLDFHTHGVDMHISLSQISTPRTEGIFHTCHYWCLSDGSLQTFRSLGDHTIASFMTSQSALWRPCCIMMSHSTLCPCDLI